MRMRLKGFMVSLLLSAHEEALKKEIERLRQVYHHQQKRSKNGSSYKERGGGMEMMRRGEEI